MEQIQRALARAKQKRTVESKASGRQPKNTRAYAGNGQSAAAPAEAAAEDLSQIEYTRTRRIECDKALLRERRVVAHLGSDAAGNVFRVLRAQVLQKLRQHDLRTLAVIGPTPGVGKSMVAANLAVAISRETNQTVLLADLDLRRPRVGWYFGIDQVELGLGDYLSGERPLEEILVNPGFERLVLLPGSERFDNASELLTSATMRSLLTELRERYTSRYVLVDLPPLLSADDAIAVLPNVDAALLVVEDGVTTAQDIAECKRLLADTRLVGVVLNKSAPLNEAAYYGYGDAYENQGG